MLIKDAEVGDTRKEAVGGSQRAQRKLSHVMRRTCKFYTETSRLGFKPEPSCCEASPNNHRMMKIVCQQHSCLFVFMIYPDVYDFYAMHYEVDFYLFYSRIRYLKYSILYR